MRVSGFVAIAFAFSGCGSKSLAGSCSADDLKLLNSDELSNVSSTCQSCLKSSSEAATKRCEHVCPSDLVACAKCFLEGPNPLSECA